jgi:uncharacterized protein
LTGSLCAAVKPAGEKQVLGLWIAERIDRLCPSSRIVEHHDDSTRGNSLALFGSARESHGPPERIQAPATTGWSGTSGAVDIENLVRTDLADVVHWNHRQRQEAGSGRRNGPFPRWFPKGVFARRRPRVTPLMGVHLETSIEDCPMNHPPLPPFTAETAAQKVRLAEDAWNTRDPARVALAYTTDSRWRNRAEFLQGREAIEAFLRRKWNRELNYRLAKELWAFRENRIAVRFAYEYHDDSGNWFRSYGNENWEFDEHGLMRLRIASINDLPIKESDRKYHWPLGRRPDDHPSLSDLGF